MTPATPLVAVLQSPSASQSPPASQQLDWQLSQYNLGPTTECYAKKYIAEAVSIRGADDAFRGFGHRYECVEFACWLAEKLEASEAAEQAAKALVEEAARVHEIMAEEAVEARDKWRSLNERMHASDARMEGIIQRYEKSSETDRAQLERAWEEVEKREYELSAREAALEPATPMYGFVCPPQPPQ